MNNDYVEKNLVYQDQVQQIATIIYHAFYCEEEEFKEPFCEPKEAINNLIPMSEKIFRYFENANEAKKAIRFLHTVNPIKSKEIFDEL
jgi:hypothetical protein